MEDAAGPTTRKSNGGATAVEFALVVPALVTFIMGLIYLSMTLWAYVSLQYAAESAARCSSVQTTVCVDDTTSSSYATSHYYGPGAPTFVPESETCGHAITGSLTYTWSTPLVSFSVPLTATACFP